jgi:hypothetical protein
MTRRAQSFIRLRAPLHDPQATGAFMTDNKTRSEIRGGMLQGLAIAAVVALLAAPVLWWQRLPGPAQSPTAAAPAPAPAPRHVDLGGTVVPADVYQVAGWAVASGDHGRAAFAVIDKRRTHIYVFDDQGRLRGESAVLLGYAPGDDSVAGIGQRPIEQVRPQERTTPAGRFDAVSGRNLLDEDVIWVDYQAAVSMHRVRATNPEERRLERLATPAVEDNRISYGCVNVPADFFDKLVWPTLGRQRAVVYVLPEIKPLEQVFPQAAAWGRALLLTPKPPLMV